MMRQLPFQLLLLSEISTKDCAGYVIDLRRTGRAGILICLLIRFYGTGQHTETQAILSFSH